MFTINNLTERLSDDDELNIILLRLLDHLGHTNPFLSGIAYCEVRCPVDFVHCETN